MQSILNSIVDVEDNNIETVYNSISKKLKAMSDEGFSYSDIAKFVFNTESEDREYFYRNLGKIKKLAKSKNNLDMQAAINKIKNHMELEICRLEYLESKQKQELENVLVNNINETLTNVNSMNDKLSTYDVKIEKHNKEISDWYSNIITVLGLFSAIVVTFFGGLGAVSSMFENINGISKYRLVFILLIVVFSMFNIVFMLLYYISIITGKQINKKCANRCKKKLNSLKVKNRTSNIRKLNTECEDKNILCSRKRYPLIFYFNLIVLIMIIGTLLMYKLKI